MEHRRRRPSLIVCGLLVALIAAACGSGGDDGGAGPSDPAVTTTTTTTTSPTTTSPTTTSPTTTTASTTTPVDSVDDELGVLVFHRTVEFRHASIEAGIAAIRDMGRQFGFAVEATEDPAVFTDAGLAPYDAVVFLSTTGDVLDRAQEQAMERFVEAGRGFVGIHAATDTEYDWPWYGSLVGAYFDGHPEPQTATVRVTDPDHPTMAGVPATFERYDEWYNFDDVPGSDVTILATLDTSTYEGSTMGDVHPVVWAHEGNGGRSFYTAFGHTEESYEEPLFLGLIANAIKWAARDSNPAPWD